MVEAAKLVPTRGLLGDTKISLGWVEEGAQWMGPTEHGHGLTLKVVLDWYLPDRMEPERRKCFTFSHHAPYQAHHTAWMSVLCPEDESLRSTALKVLVDTLKAALHIMWAHELQEGLWDGEAETDPHFLARTGR